MDCTGIDTRQPQSWLMMSFHAEGARAELDKISDRNRMTQRYLRAEGRYHGGIVPFGCRVDDEGRLQRDDDEAQVLHRAATMILAGKSPRAAALALNADGTLYRGKTWDRPKLVRCLETEGAREHVFTLAEQDALDKRLHPGAGGAKGGKPRTWLLSSWMACASCGSPCNVIGGARGQRYYRCTGAQTGATRCASPGKGDAPTLDAYLADAYLERWGDLPMLEEIVEVVAGDLDAAERAFRIAQARAADTLDDRDVEAARRARAALDQARTQPVQVHRRIDASKTHRQLWDASTQEARAAQLWTALHEVKLSAGVHRAPASTHPDRLEFTWKDEVS